MAWVHAVVSVLTDGHLRHGSVELEGVLRPTADVQCHDFNSAGISMQR